MSFEVAGPGQLIAVGAPDPMSEALYTGDRRGAFEGRLMAVVRSTGEPGEITLRATAAGLSTASITVEVPEG